MDVLNDKYIVQWFSTLKTEGTKSLYTAALSHYCEYTGMTLPQLIEEATASQKLGL